MRSSRLAVAALAAFAFHASAQTTTAVTGMGDPPSATYQPRLGVSTYEQATPDNIAFHAGGVAACDGCHVMHNTQGGVAKSTTGAGASVAPWTNVTNAYLLQGSDQSSTCLICHAGSSMAMQFYVMDAAMLGGSVDNNPTVGPSNRTPGGDFGWTRQSYQAATSTTANVVVTSPGERHGHNIAAADHGMDLDPNFLEGMPVPGGTWASSAGRGRFACSSCHDPHGRYRIQYGTANQSGTTYKIVGPGESGGLPIAASGSYGAEPSDGVYAVGTYRLLAGKGYAPASNASSPFSNDPPIAVAPQTYNAKETTTEVRVAYGTGMSEWCQNCHTNIHLDGYTSGASGFRHPAGSDSFLHASQALVYNTYISSGKVGTSASLYTSLVPFEQGRGMSLTDLRLKTAPNSSIVAGASSSVMCLSCHRAHASAFDSMIRWDQNATFLTDTSDFTGGLTKRALEVTKAGYYDRSVSIAPNGSTVLGQYQRSLCNKCHGKD